MADTDHPTPSETDHAVVTYTPDEGPAQPSDEAEDRNKSPAGGRGYDDGEVAIDPEDAPSANSFIVQITLAMFMVVVLLSAAAITGSTILLILALVSILAGLSVVLRAVFSMMSTD